MGIQNIRRKRVRCPKCDQFITFDETKYDEGQSLVFECPTCYKQFGIRIGVSKLRSTRKEENPEEEIDNNNYGSIVVIENVFHYKQVLPLRLGDNVIGRYEKGTNANTPIETRDPSMDKTHCIINVSFDKNNKIKYTLRDAPSNTGTFVNNEILGDRERRIITDGTIFNISAANIILRGAEKEE